MKHVFWVWCWALLWGGGALAQIPVEVFVGDKRASFDLMFFRFFKNEAKQNSRFLFFSRARTLVNYQAPSPTNVPLFGFTEAVSYNHPKLKGVAPVLVGQVLNQGAFAKMGLQFAHVSETLTIFSWAVAELGVRPDVDVFLLMRYTPSLGGKWRFFGQVESINVLPTDTSAAFTFTQRLRIGLKRDDWQFGAGVDFVTAGRERFVFYPNIGGFVRHEF